MDTYANLKLGVCPIGKFAFSNEDALNYKDMIYRKLDSSGIKYCTIEDVVPQGIIRSESQVDSVVKSLKANQVEALFMPHCNFGTEGAVGVIAKELGVPVLLWGPRDEMPLQNGIRMRDSLCGLLASSKVLTKLGVKFTYIENCNIEDEIFINELNKFLRACSVVKAVHYARIGQIGTRINFFWSTIIDESSLLKRFGIEILPIDMVEFIKAIKDRSAKDKIRYLREVAEIRKWLVSDWLDDQQIVYSLAMRDQFIALSEEYHLNAFAYQSFSSVHSELGEGMGLGDALAQEKLPIAPETDIHGAISSIMLEAAADGQPSFMPEFTIRHAQDDNCVLLWHVSAPPSLRHDDCRKVEIMPSWILEDLPATNLQFKHKEGDITVCRFDGEDNEYKLGVGAGKIVPGPYTREAYAWLKVGEWRKWERKLIEGPYIHHCSCIYGNYVEELKLAGRYLPGLAVECFDD